MSTLTLRVPHVADFVALTKPRIVGFIVVTAAAGFWLAPGAAPASTLLHLVIGTALVAAGTCALNQIVERDVDARMERTRNRPMAAGRLGVPVATTYAWLLTLTGLAWLWAFTNPTTVVLAAATVVSYVYLYTPLKRRTTLSTLVGAVPGALPILGGWVAAGGAFTLVAAALFWTLFLWQLPHFLALAWLYRKDYARAGLRMLSAEEPDPRLTFGLAAVYAGALLPVSLLPSLLGATGVAAFGAALVLGVWVLVATVRAALARDVDAAARRLFLASVAYLPLLLLVMVFNAR